LSETTLWETEETDQLPPRRRRRWRVLTPVTGVLFAVLLVALGFIAGALAERGKARSSTAGSGAPRAGFGARGGAGGFGGQGGPPGAAAGGGSAVVGQVANLSGRTIYLTDTQGNTVKVRVPKGATVTKTSNAGFGAINPGDSLVVQGATAKNGTVTAGSIRATAASIGGASALSALFGGGGGGGGGGGARAGAAGRGGTP
jgi:hypothetical protein